MRKPFTVVEMLTVLVVMGLLLAASMPALTNLAKGGGVDAAERILGGQLRFAKSYALQRRTYVGLILVDEEVMGDDFDRNYRLVRLAELRKVPGYSEEASYEFKRWVSGFAWEELPPNVVVEIENGEMEIFEPSGLDASKRRESLEKGFDSLREGARPQALKGLIIKPSGKPVISGGVRLCDVKVTEGYWDGDTGELIYADGSTTGEDGNTLYLDINVNTGQIWTKYADGVFK